MICWIFIFLFLHEIEIAHLKKITDDEPLIVSTSLGLIQGSIIKSRLNKDIYSFRGIRFGKAPVNELRFKPPVPVDPWDGVYNATVDGPFCPQPTDFLVSEDCLVLNVYSTQLPTNDENPKRPVLVFFHAGGFYSVGSMSNIYGPNYLMDQPIVLVTVNYRLATLGFLSTGDKEATGNYGLKDQVLALKWVQKQIEYFGGDKDSVTIGGYSAGGASVTLHLVSPMSKGLFHRAIAMSGSILGNWPIGTNQLDLAKKQARILGCPDDTSANIVNCLKTKPALDLGNSLDNFTEFVNDPIIVWDAVIEDDNGEERFLPDHPIRIIERNEFTHVPLITGITEVEFGYLAYLLLNSTTYTEEFNKDYYRLAPISFIYERNSSQTHNISEQLRKFYLNNEPVNKSSLPELSNLYNEAVIGFGVNRAVKLISEKSTQPVYYYEFTYHGQYSHFYINSENKTMGTVHHDDLIYLFYIQISFPLFHENSPKEVEMVEKLGTLWLNFITTGNPTPSSTPKLDNVTWEAFNTQTKKYLNIDETLVMKDNLHETRYELWEQLFPISGYLQSTHN